MFGWWRERRRRKILQRPFPGAWREILSANVPYSRVLQESERLRLEQIVAVLIHEKNFEGCDGFEVNDEVRVTIAGHAAVLILHRDDHYYPKLRTILVYAESFWVTSPEMGEDGVWSESSENRAGESWDLGVVVLAWNEVVRSYRRWADGYNVVIHEFAHQLDQEDWTANGRPIIHDSELSQDWARVLTRGFEQHVHRVGSRHLSVIDEYGSVNPAEFFAVAAETFFEKPLPLKRQYPELYQALHHYFRQDPAEKSS